MQTFAINGFGRIGRLATRIWLKDFTDKITLKAINTSGSMDLEGWAYLFKYDTAYGPFQGEVKTQEHQTKEEVTDQDPLLGHLLINDYKIPVFSQREPEKLPWEEEGIDLVIESTGVFRTEEEASKHLKAGAKKVLISAPGKGGNVETTVLGTDHDDPTHTIASNASCTTNSTSPLVAAIGEELGIQKAMLTTIHAYTDSQNLQDGSSRKDLRRGRAAAENMIPTTTGAAKATTKVVPALKGKFDGLALRIPLVTGSLTDLTLLTDKDTSVEEINQVFKKAEKGRWQGIIATTEEPLVSSDIIGRPESAIVDLEMTRVVDGNLVKVIAWYDNEWGFTTRLVETAAKILTK